MVLGRRTVLGLGALAALGGCTPDPTSSTAPAPGPRAGQASAQDGRGLEEAVGRLRAALEARDARAFAAVFAQPLRTRADLVFDNALLLGSFAVEAVPERPGLRVRWRLGEERDPSTSEFWAGVSPQGLIERLEEPAGQPWAATWSRHPVRVLGAGPVRLLAAEERADASAAWLEAAVGARTHLIAAGLEPWASTWDGSLLVDVPHDLIGYAGRAHAAASVVFGGPGDAGRIMLNPTLLADADAPGRVGLLVHEGVHVVSRSGFMEAPLWVAEGLAEHTASAVWPAAARDNDRRVRERLADGLPAGLPTDEELRAGSGALTAYALAAEAVRGCFDRWGRREALAWMAAWDAPGRPGEDELRRAYLTRLARR